MPDRRQRNHSGSRTKGVLAAVGPGVVAGAADDDPSGIAAFSIAGASFGTSLLWTAPLTWPFMAAAQMMCARIGLMTGQGLAGAFRSKYSRGLLIPFLVILFIVNTINIGADLSGMADAAQLITGAPPSLFVFLFGIFMILATMRLRYDQMTRLFQWLALLLSGYAVSAFLVHPDWRAVLHDAFRLSIPRSPAEWSTLIALIGSTFTPYFFVWQAAEEVEVKKIERQGEHLHGARGEDLRFRGIDVLVGTFFSRIVMFFVILTAALTLHTRGVRVSTAADAARALEPVSGAVAKYLYAGSLIAVGLLVIPVLATTAAYALSEALGWHHGLDEKARDARPFYAVIVCTIAGGMMIQFTHVQSMSVLFWTGFLNGIIAPFLLLGALLIASDRRLMKERPLPWIERAIVGVSIAMMFGAAVAMAVVSV